MNMLLVEMPFDPANEINALRSLAPDKEILSLIEWVPKCGMSGNLQSLYVEHYPGMTEPAIEQCMHAAELKWNLTAIRVVYRVGVSLPGEALMLVAVASSHRSAAFAACEFVADHLKASVPLWKKECGIDHSRWLEASELDVQRMARWRHQPDLSGGRRHARSI